MTARTAFLGVDLGTSGLKLALLGEDGALLAEAESAYEVSRPRPGWAETDPARWVEALNRAVDATGSRLRAVRLAGVGVTGQMHGAVLCGERGRPVRPAVLWPDQRAEPQLNRWRHLPADVRDRLANPLAPGMTGPIVSWLLDHEAETMARASRVVLPKDYLREIIVSGGAGGSDPVTERSDASATLLWDVVTDGWSTAAVSAAGLPSGLLPPVVEPATVVGHAAWLAERIGSSGDGPPVVAGAGDTPAAMLAVSHAGADPHATQINLGTGAQVLRRVAAPYPVAAPTTHLYVAADHGWYAMAAVQNAGLALDWAGRILGLDWPELVAAARTSPTGAGGVSFLPFLTGERGGLAGPASRGAWLGLHAATSRADLARAAVEAMVFVVRRGAELLGPTGECVQLTGGGGRDPWIRSLLADCLGAAVQRIKIRSASATGAALLAARAVGVPVPVSPAGERAAVTEPRPDEALDEAYRRWLGRLPTADA